MSDVAIHREGDGAFRPVTIALILAIGLIGFFGSLVLGAYAPDLKSGRNGGGHALSNAATGFSGIVQLAAATGRHPTIVRDTRQWASEDLLVATPEHGATDISGIIRGRQHQPTLIVLPKWSTVADPAHGGWVRIDSLLDPGEPQGVLAPVFDLPIMRHASGGSPLMVAPSLPGTIAFTAPRPLQVMTGATIARRVFDARAVVGDFTPLITDGHGGVVLAQIGPGPLYVLADPDLIDNAGLSSLGNARSALALLDWLNLGVRSSIGFDVTLNGFAGSKGPLTLAFQPPFLAMTLALLAVAALLGLHAVYRFGSPRPRERAIAFGKAALVDNSAALIRKAGRTHRLGGRYAQVIRERAARAFGASAALKGDGLDAYLDTVRGGSFTALAAAAEQARDDDQLLAAAQALHDWQLERDG
jgi:hypothetical protein